MGFKRSLAAPGALATMVMTTLPEEPATASEGGCHMMVSHRITRLVAVGLAAGALASPVASARPLPVGYSPHPVQDLRSPDTRDAALISQGLIPPPTTNVVRVDEL